MARAADLGYWGLLGVDSEAYPDCSDPVALNYVKSGMLRDRLYVPG